MTDRSILILGAGVMQAPAIRLARQRGLTVIVADGDRHAPSRSLADRFELVDLKDKEGMEALARRLKADAGLAGIMTAGTDFSATVAWVAERLGLPGIPYEVALDCSDKARMRARFSAAGIPSPRFAVMHAVPAAAPLATAVSPATTTAPAATTAPATTTAPAAIADGPDGLSFPLVVKPVDNMGGRGCRRVDSPEELSDAVADALRFSRSGRAIVEEFLDGPEFSVDSLVCNGEITICGLADRHIFYPPYFIEMGHTMPTSLSPEKQEELLSVFKRAVKALGITNGAAKGDVKFTSKGPAIGEIAARLSGGYMSGWTFPYASGVEVTDGALSIALGEKPASLEPKRDWVCAERAFLSIPGVVRSLEGVETARTMSGIKDLFLRAAPGQAVTFPRNNVSKAGNLISLAPTREQSVGCAEAAIRAILIPLVFPNSETAAFLARGPSAKPSFPPDAYTLSTELLSALAGLDDTFHRESRPAGAPPAASLPRVLHYLPFPAFESARLLDWAGRPVEETLQAVSRLSGIRLLPFDGSSSSSVVLGRSFWAALARGGYQGALYYLDSLPGPD